MNKLIVYAAYLPNGLSIGNTDGKFNRYPPTMEDIRKMEYEISKKHCDGRGVVILNILPIAPEGNIE